MPTNRDTLDPLERQQIDLSQMPASLDALNDLLGAPGRAALILGPIRLADGLQLPARAALRVPDGHELLVLVGERLREILPAGRYPKLSWSGQPDVELHLVDVRERILELDIRREISLSYPISATERASRPHDLRVGLAYQVFDADLVARRLQSPLRGLFDAALHLLFKRLEGTPIDELAAFLDILPAELRARGSLAGLGVRVREANLLGWPLPADEPRPEAPAHALLAILEEQVAALKRRDPPILAQVRPIEDGYVVSVPLRDRDGDVLLLRVIYSHDLRRQAPQLTVRLNDQLRDYRPALLNAWKSIYTLTDLVDAIIEDHTS